MDAFIQSIFVNKFVTVGWVNTRGESPQPTEGNGVFGTDTLIALG